MFNKLRITEWQLRIFVAATLCLGQFCNKKILLKVWWVYYIVFWFDVQMHIDQKWNSNAPKSLI